MDLPNLFVTPPFVVLPEHLEADSIHLTPAAGSLFLCSLGLFLRAEASSDVTLVSEQVNLEESSDSDSTDGDGSTSNCPDGDEDKLGAILKIVKSNSKRLGTVKPLKTALDQLTTRTLDIETQV